MRHRIGMAECTHLGNPEPCELNNQWSGNEKLDSLCKEMFDEAISLWFKDRRGLDMGGVDFGIQRSDGKIIVSFGLEPAYKLQRYFVITVNTYKGESNQSEGIAYGFYGSNIVKTTRFYKDYKVKSKFIRFVDKWQPKLFDILKSKDGENADSQTKEAR